MIFQGIRVQVRSVYIESRSQPSKGHYFFAYRIRITNNSERPVQLLRRHWIITDANGKTENVWSVIYSFQWHLLYMLIIPILSSRFIEIFLHPLNYFIIFPHCRGIGVIGEQPVVLPQTSFEYSSACPLSTANGRMVRLFSFIPFPRNRLKSCFIWFVD